MPRFKSNQSAAGKTKLKVLLEDGVTTDYVVRDGAMSLKDFVEEEMENELPELNFKNIHFYSAGQRLDDDQQMAELPGEIMALSCPDPPPPWMIPGPGSHLALQALRRYTILSPVMCEFDDSGKGRKLGIGCKVEILEVMREHVKLKTLTYNKHNVEGVVPLQKKPLFGFSDLPLSLLELQNYVMVLQAELHAPTSKLGKPFALLPRDVVSIGMDSDFVYKNLPEEVTIVVQKETDNGPVSGTIKLFSPNKDLVLRPQTLIAEAVVGQWHYVCTSKIRFHKDYADCLQNSDIVLVASHTSRGTSLLNNEGDLVLLDKKMELLNIRQTFALQAMSAFRKHPRMYEKIHYASVCPEMISFRSRWLASMQAGLGMVQTKQNMVVFQLYAPTVAKAKSIIKVADRVQMNPLAVVSALLHV